MGCWLSGRLSARTSRQYAASIGQLSVDLPLDSRDYCQKQQETEVIMQGKRLDMPLTIAFIQESTRTIVPLPLLGVGAGLQSRASTIAPFG